MSRIGNRVITIPEKVTVTLEGNVVKVVGPKGELSTEIHKDITVDIKETEMTLGRNSESVKPFHGTANANISNMIKGVTTGFEKSLEAVGVGYRFAKKGDEIVVTAGYSHPITVKVPKGLEVDVPSNTELTVKGIDKQLVGELAANIRDIRRPEPYKGKGIRYKDEIVRRKEGKKVTK